MRVPIFRLQRMAAQDPAKSRTDEVLLGGQLLRRDLACRAVLIRIPHLGPKRARLVLLAFRDIEIGKIELRPRWLKP